MAPDDIAKILQAELNKERTAREDLERTNKSLIEEFSKANTHDEIVEIAQTGIKKALPNAITQIHNLINNAESESVRASLSKYVIDTVLTRKVEAQGNEDLKLLLQQLSANGSEVTSK